MTSISDASTNDDIASDIYSLTDQQLAANLEFMQEIGYGNWGSVWSCRSRVGTPAQTRRRLAVKLVHRTSSRTTPARVRSLWNEMKIVRSLKDNKHPAIIDFHSFIITPSYALITMEFLPRLVPVEVRESKAKIWFKSLLDGVAHLHVHGIVHNDIKPANILLTRAEQPVLVDFGFAEKYDLDEPILRPSRSVLASPSSSSSSLTPSVPKAPFESNLAYGTPEYLSPERAKGYIHDTRKSDVWSLGVTFFEIIIGRTPFELEEGEEFSSKEDLERYWHRTNNDIWVGTWKMSIGLERLLRAMLRPDADQRLNAPEVLNDPYFTVPSGNWLSSLSIVSI
ncbi:kinase-like domain-containing protein [Cantharellus anzutake]|uniref:kinase-like domain-containing protein n=1 Tax=Cantharellus anzutake TaxID=1750568 RepID=UPI00190804A8|nr:kinase-like domain-containing protein [Cantharellus anzutake]KAF8340367.1 kinase-like domain-containing protein [Cantharellus anzutake]